MMTSLLVEKYAIIVAGGSGSRMQNKIPKQFLTLNGLPILMHSIKAFASADASIELIITLPEDQMHSWKQLCRKYDFTIIHSVVAGGSTRYHSVLNGLQSIKSTNGVVAIHDGVRPLISPGIIAESYKQAGEKGNAVACVPMKDSVRQIDEFGGNVNLQRDRLVAVQTPQTFEINAIKGAFGKGFKPYFTDDASVFEAAGGKINLISGSYSNIKITTPDDLLFAEAYIKNEVSN